jgi:hypothetical protein
MQVFARSIMARITLAVVALWLGAGPARAGGGGADALGLQNSLNTLCGLLSMSTCPQLPTASQLVIEISALKTASPELVRFEGELPPPSPADVINAVNPPAAPNLVPLAFVSGTTAAVTGADDPAANSLFTAFADEASQTLNLTYDFFPAPNTAKGQTIATLSLPLVILNSDFTTEKEAPTTIVVLGGTGSCKGCVPISAMATTKALGAVNVDPAKLGVTITASTTPSNHLILSVQAKLVVSSTRDPSYFVVDPVFTTSAVFFRNPNAPAPGGDPGFPSKLLASGQLGIGIAPYAGPLCSGNSPCVSNAPSSNYPYCANIGGQSAVAAFLSIGNFGETYASAPRQPLAGVTCP